MRRRYNRLDPRGYIELKPSPFLVPGPITFSEHTPYIHPDAKLYLLKDWSKRGDPHCYVITITAVMEDGDLRRPGIVSGRDALVEAGGKQLGVAVRRWISNCEGWDLFICFAYPGLSTGPFDSRPGFLIVPNALVDLPSTAVPRSPRYSRTSYSMRDRLKRVARKNWLDATLKFCDGRGGTQKACGRPQKLWKGMKLQLNEIIEEEEVEE